MAYNLPNSLSNSSIFSILIIMFFLLFTYDFTSNSFNISKFFTNLSPFLLYVLTNR
jgi:hypothetical protein